MISQLNLLTNMNKYILFPTIYGQIVSTLLLKSILKCHEDAQGNKKIQQQNQKDNT